MHWVYIVHKNKKKALEFSGDSNREKKGALPLILAVFAVFGNKDRVLWRSWRRQVAQISLCQTSKQTLITRDSLLHYIDNLKP